MLLTVPRCKTDSQEHQPSPLLKTATEKLLSRLNLSKMTQSHVTGSIPQSQGRRAGKLTQVDDDVSFRSLRICHPCSQRPHCSFQTQHPPRRLCCFTSFFFFFNLFHFFIFSPFSLPLLLSVLQGETVNVKGGDHVTFFQEAECLLYPYCPSLS